MCWSCARPDARHEDHLTEVVLPTVARHGWMVQVVLGDRLRAPLAYTVGLTVRGLPELVVTGVDDQPAAALLNAVAAELLHHGRRLRHGGSLALSSTGPRVEVVQLPAPDAHLVTALEVYGPAVRGLQLVWADDSGLWPWDRGFRGGRGGQPVLGPRAVRPPQGSRDRHREGVDG